MKSPARFPVDVASAVALQRALAPLVRPANKPRRLRIVAAADVAYDAASGRSWGAVVRWDLSRETVISAATASALTPFPYVPGLLSFREAPLLYEVLKPLKRRFDVLLVDGQGIAHPRRFGIASHLGVLLGKPTIGCAKSRLCGDEPADLANARGARAPLYHRGARVGTVLRTRPGVKPVYVSVGHLCRLRWAEELVLALATRYRLPEPLRLVHHVVGEIKRAALR